MLPVQPRRSEVRWRPGQEATLTPPCSNLRSFGSQCIALKKAHVILLGFLAPLVVIWRPIVIRRPGNCALFSPTLRPCNAVRDSGVDLHDTRDVTRGGGATGHNSRPPNHYGAPNHCWGHRITAGCPVKSQQCHKYFKYSVFAFKRPQVRTQGRQTCFGGPFGAPKLTTPRGVTRIDGARRKNQICRPIFEPEVLRKQIYCIEGSICDIVGNFRRPHNDFGARGIAPPLHPLVSLIVVFVT